jgi:hypothetical protein
MVATPQNEHKIAAQQAQNNANHHIAWSKMDNAAIQQNFEKLSGEKWQAETLGEDGRQLKKGTAVLSTTSPDTNKFVDAQRHLKRIDVSAEVSLGEDTASLKVATESVKTVQKKHFEKLDEILKGLGKQQGQQIAP